MSNETGSAPSWQDGLTAAEIADIKRRAAAVTVSGVLHPDSDYLAPEGEETDAPKEAQPWKWPSVYYGISHVPASRRPKRFPRTKQQPKPAVWTGI